MRIKLSFLLLLTLTIFSCKPEPENPMTGEPTPPVDNSVEVIVPTGDEQYLNEDSDYIFDQEKLHTIELNLPQSSLDFLDNDPTAEEYVEGSLTFEGETISPVGIRYKGSVGAYVGCVSGNDWANPSGRKTCTKLSMKIKINWEGSDNKFYGLKKVQLHSMNNDPSQMRERLGYHLFREMGVPAPRCVHTRVLINGVYVGLFALAEQIDGRFTRYNYEDGEGNLYKELWPLNSNNQIHSENTYLSALKTNEDENPTVELIRGFANEMKNSNESNRQSIVESYMDKNEFISYAVVDRTIRNDDGAFHWYCDNGTCAPHNFYWYEEPNEGKVHLIPWDLDHAFENIISNQNPVVPIADEWGETRENCEPFSYGFFFFQQKSAACDKIVGAWASYEEEYSTRLTEFKESAFSETEINTLLEAWEEQIRDATLEANQAHDDAISVNSWENAMNSFRDRINYARNN